MSKTIFPHVPVTHSADRRSWLIYGKSFPHDRTPKGQAAARQAAETYGIERQTAMTAQSGRRLTAREEIEGRLAKPPAPDAGPQPCGVRRVADPNANPYTAVVRSLETQFAPKPSDKAKVARRLDLYRKKEAEWNAEAASRVVAADVSNDPEVVRFRKHAADKLDAAQLDGKLTPAQVEQRYALKALADNAATSPGDYWTAVRDTFPSEAAPVAKPTGPTNLYGLL